MKVWMFLYISITLILVLHFLGFNTGLTPLLDKVIDLTYDDAGLINEASSKSGFWDIIWLAIGSLTALTGVYATAYLSTGDRLTATKASLASVMLYPFIKTYFAILSQAIATGQSWVVVVFSILFIPLIGGYIFSLLEYVGGTD